MHTDFTRAISPLIGTSQTSADCRNSLQVPATITAATAMLITGSIQAQPCHRYSAPPITTPNDSSASAAMCTRDYTNGVSLTAFSRNIPAGADPACLPLPLPLPLPLRLHAALIRGLDPAFWRSDAASLQNAVVKLGQSMYTPADPARIDLIVGDRPYAGLLYAGLSWNDRRLDVQRRVEMLDTREVTLGVIGLLSLARQMQDLVHHVKGVDRFQGWDNQLHNEPALQLAREQKWRDYRGAGSQIEGFTLDAIRSLGLRVGNIETSASVGVEARMGWNMPNDFGSYPIRPGAENRPPTTLVGGGNVPRGRTGAHLFAMLEGRLVAWDFTLDGNLFRNSHSVTRRPWLRSSRPGSASTGRLQATVSSSP